MLLKWKWIYELQLCSHGIEQFHRLDILSLTRKLYAFYSFPIPMRRFRRAQIECWMEKFNPSQLQAEVLIQQIYIYRLEFGWRSRECLVLLPKKNVECESLLIKLKINLPSAHSTWCGEKFSNFMISIPLLCLAGLHFDGRKIDRPATVLRNKTNIYVNENSIIDAIPFCDKSVKRC